MSIKEIQERHDEDMEEYTRYFDDVGDVPIEVKDRGELLDALREIGELLPRCETIHKLGIGYDKEDGSVTRWSMGVSIAAQGRRLAIELQTIMDKL